MPSIRGILEKVGILFIPGETAGNVTFELPKKVIDTV